MTGTKYLKLFETHAEYQTYINGQDSILPNVSYCEDNNDVHYNPWVAPSRVLTAVYNIPTTANPISLYLDDFPNEIESVLVTRPNGTTFELSSTDLVEYDSICECGDPYMGYQFDMTGEHTFEYTFKPNVTTFSYQLFGFIPYVTSVNIPNCITSISTIDYSVSAFNVCTGLTSIIIPNSVTTIGNNAFDGCSGLTSITIPNSVTTIGNNAFYGCSGLTSIVVNSGNSVYDSRDNCNAIIETASNTLIAGCQNTVIPNSVTSIGVGAFGECSGLTSVTIPNSVTSIGVGAFFNCSGLTSITIGSSVTTIGDSAFDGCIGLTSITIPDSVTSIGESAFNVCTGLTSVTIGNSVTTIGMGAFAGCIGLTSITIPDSVTSIGESAFYICSGLTSITVEATTPPTLGVNAFEVNASGRKIYVPSESVATYKAASQWSTYAADIEAIPTT